MAPIDLRLGQNAFQVIPELSLCDIEDKTFFGFFGIDYFVLAETHVSWPETHGSWLTTQPSWPVLAAKTHIFSSISGRTDFIIGASKAKNHEDFDFDIHLPVEHPKLAKKKTKMLSDAENNIKKKSAEN